VDDGSSNVEVFWYQGKDGCSQVGERRRAECHLHLSHC